MPAAQQNKGPGTMYQVMGSPKCFRMVVFTPQSDPVSQLSLPTLAETAVYHFFRSSIALYKLVGFTGTIGNEC
jgi:hypothetical protein